MVENNIVFKNSKLFGVYISKFFIMSLKIFLEFYIFIVFLDFLWIMVFFIC